MRSEELNQDQRDALRFCALGVYEGLACDWEADQLPALIRMGYARRDYAHTGGMLGLAKIHLTEKGLVALGDDPQP